MTSFFDSPPAEEPKPLCAQPAWVGPGSNVLGVLVPVDVVLARTDDAAVALGPITAYPNGFEVRVRLRLRGGEPIHPMAMHPGGGKAFRFGVRFSDGRKATADARSRRDDEPPEPPRVTMRGGSGTMGAWDWGFWIWGLPTAGKLTFVCDWPDQKIPESSAEIEAEPILAAAATAELLWPEGAAAAGTGGMTQILVAQRDDPPPEPPK
jgi:hypothetical protein